MNDLSNKGDAPIVTALVIVAILIIAGGGIYYLKQKFTATQRQPLSQFTSISGDLGSLADLNLSGVSPIAYGRIFNKEVKRVKQGELFEIGVQEQPSTGYGWTPYFMKSQTELKSYKFVSDYALIGSPGKTVYTFKSNMIGEFYIYFVYSGPGRSKPEKIEYYKIISSANTSPTSSVNLTQPSITILAPIEGETLTEGEDYVIRWSSQNLPSNAEIMIFVAKDRTKTVSDSSACRITPNFLPANATPYTWKTSSHEFCEGLGAKSVVNKVANLFIGRTLAATVGPYYVYIQASVPSSGYQRSMVAEAWSGPITISGSPFVQVLSPNGGESWQVGNTYTITWKSDLVDKIKIRVSAWGVVGSEYVIADSVRASLGSYLWTIPSTLQQGNNYTLSVDAEDVAGSYIGVLDGSDSFFSIVPGT